MKQMFVRALIINAVFQFVVTRHRAGRAIEEGAAEMMWVRYPASVLLNALLWSLMLTTLGRLAGALRGAR
jgi:hypothetical protein